MPHLFALATMLVLQPQPTAVCTQPSAIEKLTFQQKSQAEWLPNLEDAKGKAKDSGRDVIAVFHGSDWCTPCMALDRIVWKKEIGGKPFTEAMSNNFIFANFDFVRDQSKLSADQKAQLVHRDAVQKELNVPGYPTILLMTSDGFIYGKTGFVAEMDADAYAHHLRKMQENGKKVAELRKSKSYPELVQILEQQGVISYHEDILQNWEKNAPEQSRLPLGALFSRRALKESKYSPDDSVRFATKALQLLSADTSTHPAKPIILQDSYIAMGLAYEAKGPDFKMQALSSFQKALEALPTSPKANGLAEKIQKLST